ncbi:MAG: tRNA (N(6)-L-threonylcarbamoyladenosine(37)-C(2))-methylthiotransferase MtaB [Thermodesulfobacteriota bacterium]
MKVSVTTLGCRSNQYDSAALEDSLREARMELTDFPGPADAVVINTCTVTSRTDSQSRQLIRRARKQNPDAVVVVTGCYAQVSPEDVAGIEGVDYVIGNPDKGSVVECLKKGRNPGATETRVSDYRAGAPLTLRARSASGRARANLKIQDGCDRACSYCIIPRARGRSKSLAMDEVEREIAGLAQAGYREIILTGIHLGAWGADLDPRHSIADVLKHVARKAQGWRVRLSSIDADEVTGELIDVMKTAPQVCSHLHLPLQSGDDSVIRGMNRPYTATLFADKVTRIAREVKDVAIGVDVIAGFPGEGDREFENTFRLLSDLPVAYMHVFPFSPRRGTPASEMPERAEPAVVRQRCARLRELGREKREAFYRRFVGRTMEVLAETRGDRNGLARGRTSNYIPVLFEANTPPGGFTAVRLTGYDGSTMYGYGYGAVDRATPDLDDPEGP